MGIVYKVLGQSNPAANTNTALYTVPANTSTVISTVTICNQSATSAWFNLAVQPAGAALANKHYVNFNTPVPGNDTVSLTLGITLGNTDILSCNANTSTVSFNVFGSEIS
jgi:hypothetical protein